MSGPGLTWVVLVTYAGKLGVEIIGPYKSWARADADARAWDGIGAAVASVEPIQHPQVWQSLRDQS